MNILKFIGRQSNKCYEQNKLDYSLFALMLRHNFCRPDDRLVKLSLFSTLLDKSPLTSIYFATFEKKREVMPPLPTQSKFLVFGKFYII